MRILCVCVCVCVCVCEDDSQKVLKNIYRNFRRNDSL